MKIRIKLKQTKNSAICYVSFFVDRRIKGKAVDEGRFQNWLMIVAHQKHRLFRQIVQIQMLFGHESIDDRVQLFACRRPTIMTATIVMMIVMMITVDVMTNRMIVGV
jgi:hypothetical protein